jgi:hypothetical protein
MEDLPSISYCTRINYTRIFVGYKHEESFRVAAYVSMLYTKRMREQRTHRRKVIDIKTRKPVYAKVLISQPEFIDLLETMERYIEHLRAKREGDFDESLEIIKEMKFCGTFNFKFRQETYPQLEELLDEIYAEIHS